MEQDLGPRDRIKTPVCSNRESGGSAALIGKLAVKGAPGKESVTEGASAGALQLFDCADAPVQAIHRTIIAAIHRAPLPQRPLTLRLQPVLSLPE